MNKKTLILGASKTLPGTATWQKLRAHGHEVVAIGLKRKVDDVEIIKGKPDAQDIDTITS